MYVGLYATHAMTKKQFLQQPPPFVVVMKISFDYNFMTFLFRDEPRVIPLEELEDAYRQPMETQRG